jgi:hypothetical protein
VTTFGLKLMSEIHGPLALVVRAIDARFERIAIVPVGDDAEGFFSFWDEHVRPALA